MTTRLRALTNRRHLARAALLVIVSAGWLVAASLLWDTEVPNDLGLPEVNAGSAFGAGFLDRSSDFERFARINLLLSQVVLLVVLVAYARRGARLARESAAGPIGTGMLLAMLGLGLVWLAQLPFGIVGLWWERRHDVAEVGYFEWVIDSFFGLGSVFLFVCFAVVIAMALAGLMPRRWWIPAIPAFLAVGALVAFVQPYLLPDLHSPRSERLAADSRELARAQHVSDIPVEVEDVGEFTDAPNAEATGLGPSRRVILWDTIVEKPFEPEEVRMVIAHELAHHSRDHIPKSLGWFGLLLVPTLLAIAVATAPRGGMRQARSIPVALLVFVALSVATTPLQSLVSRRMEAEADWVALETGRDPAAARSLERRLAIESLTDPDPPGWAHVLFDTHPATVDRIAMADAWAARR